MLRIKSLTQIALCAALIAILAQILFPIPSVPLTLQTLGVAFCGYFLGAKKGGASVAVYLLMGAVGLPVFSAFSGGFSALIGPAGGFLWGFLPLSILCGIQRENPLSRFGFGALGLLICHLIGALWYSFTTDAGILAAFLTITLPTIWKDLLSLALGLFLSKRLQKILNR